MRPRGEVEQGGPGDGAGAIGVPELPSWTMVRYVIAVTAYVLAGTHTYVWRTDTRLFERVRLVLFGHVPRSLAEIHCHRQGVGTQCVARGVCL
jgi:hypothetical protein